MDLVPKGLIVQAYFSEAQAAIDKQQADLENLAAQMTELEEEHSGEEGLYSELEKVSKTTITARLKELKTDKNVQEEVEALNAWLKLNTQQAALKKVLKQAEAELDALCLAKYPHLSEAEIKSLVVNDKWLATLSAAAHGEMDRVSQRLTQRVKALAERYEAPLPQLEQAVQLLSSKVEAHLVKMGFSLSIGQTLSDQS